MDKKAIALGAALLIAAGAANAELKAFKVNGETVSVAEQKAVYDRAVAQGQPAGPELESQVKNLLIQQTALLQEAKKAKIQQNADVQRAIDNARNQILIQGLAQDWAKKNPVSDADLQKAYEADKASYGDTEYQVRHILVKTEQEAKNIIQRLNKGEKFDALAKSESLDPKSGPAGGLIGWLSPSNVEPNFGNAFKILSAGDVAQAPIQNQFGWHVVKLDAKRSQKNFPTYESQKDSLRAQLSQLKAKRHFAELVQKAKVR